VKIGLGGKGNWIGAARMRLLKSFVEVTLRDRIPNENKKRALLKTENMAEQVKKYHLNWLQNEILDVLKVVAILWNVMPCSMVYKGALLH
jgi:hypothetical protein